MRERLGFDECGGGKAAIITTLCEKATRLSSAVLSLLGSMGREALHVINKPACSADRDGQHIPSCS